MDRCTRTPRTWKPTLLGWMVSRMDGFLFAPEVLGGMHRTLSEDGDTAALSETPGGEPLLTMQMKLLWPDYPECAVSGKDIGIQVHWCRPKYDEALHRRLLMFLEQLSRRVALLENRAAALIATLFPRDAQGEIDWARCPLVEQAPGPPPASPRNPSPTTGSWSLTDWSRAGKRPPFRSPWRVRHLEGLQIPRVARGEPSGRAELHFGVIPCRLHCAFCTRSLWPEYPDIPELFWAALTYRAVLDLPPAPFRGLELRLMGSEPAAHPDLVSLLRLVRQRGYGSVQLYTSVPETMSPARIAALVEAGLGSVAIPLYGTCAATHDAIVGKPGHFQRVLDAGDCFRLHGVEVLMHSVPLRQNLAELEQLPDFVRGRGFVFRVFDLPRNDGPARLPYDALVPRIGELLPAVTAHLNLRVPCLGLGPGARRFTDTVLRADSRKAEVTLAATPDLEFAPICESCRLRADCSGLSRGYLALYGDGELKPVD